MTMEFLGIVLDWKHHFLDKYVKFDENRIVSNQLSQKIVNDSLLFFLLLQLHRSLVFTGEVEERRAFLCPCFVALRI